MAANNNIYYSPFNPANGGFQTSDPNYGARPHPPSISPIPSSHHDGYPSPDSSFPLSDDRIYPTAMQPSQSSFNVDHYSQKTYGAQPDASTSRLSYNDPFMDHSAIQLQTKGLKPETSIITSPITDAETGLAQPHRRRNKRRRHKTNKSGILGGKITWACYILSAIYVAVFIYEIVRNAVLTGSPIEIHPQFNPMIGPSPYVLINVGARFVPCMRQYNVPNTTLTVASPSVGMPCPNTTDGLVPTSGFCTIADLCGHGLNLTPGPDGVQPQPNQWWRFITPIFLHGGFIHIGFNLLLQLTLGREIEQQIGTIRFLLVYFTSGIFGFVFGGNFAPAGLPSTGCSGALFGVLALVLLDLLYTWKTRPKPIRDLCFIILDVIIAFIIGLLPALDNFSHIGGFLTGLVLGVCILHSPDSLRERIEAKPPPSYATVSGAMSPSAEEPVTPELTGAADFARRPVGFFKGRKPLWWGWWLIRAGSLVIILIVFILLLRNFYIARSTCSWCKYLSCLPVAGWCDLGQLAFSTESAGTKTKRALEYAFDLAG